MSLWQRCQFHLAQNAIQQAPYKQIRKINGAKLHCIWNADNLKEAEEKGSKLCDYYYSKYPQFSEWLEENIIEGLAVFTLPNSHQKRMRNSNPIERTVMQEIKKRTRKIRVFPNNNSAMRLITAILIDIDEKWQTSNIWMNWNNKDDDIHKEFGIYIKDVA